MPVIRKFDVCTPRPKYQSRDEVWWHRVGNAFENERGQINVYLDSVPVADAKEGKVIMMLFEKKEDQQQGATRRAASKPSEDDGEIPF